MAITVVPKAAQLFVNDKEITLNDDGDTTEMYDIGAILKIKATAEGHGEKEQEYTVKDELTDGKNKLDVILAKKKVIISKFFKRNYLY